jgi:hypothetical protein
MLRNFDNSEFVGGGIVLVESGAEIAGCKSTQTGSFVVCKTRLSFIPIRNIYAATVPFPVTGHTAPFSAPSTLGCVTTLFK